MRAFFFHYNKPASIAAKRNVLTVHWKGACHLVNEIDCRVPIKTRARKSQPRCVMAGKAHQIGIATLDGARIAVILPMFWDLSDLKRDNPALEWL